ncbi:hypothetical protein K439DRAFT_1644223 [Ramaria rubella]|nr:hypothetical protein K439DRAFT_1644223 [Ramaria rubella]
MKSAADSMEITAVPIAPKKADISTSVLAATNPGMELRDLLWEDHEVGESPSALATESAPPVPHPPENELHNELALKTIDDHRNLFKIVTPINVNLLEHLLSSHPNQPFVLSVCQGLREGFWLWAITDRTGYPVTWDNLHRPIPDPAHRQFLHEQWDIEIALGQYSQSFGPDLLPGMHSMPPGVIPKPHSDKLRLINDLSAGQFPCNSMIPKGEGSVRLNGMRSFGKALQLAHHTHPGSPLTIFKSNITRAYWLIPMHPLWQLHQIITIDGERHVNRCNCFGGWAGCCLFYNFMSLVLWIAEHIVKLRDLFTYVDDNFSWELAHRTLFYPPYKRFFPEKQTRLLFLWDDLHIPHEERKQEFGVQLKIICYFIKMDSSSKSDLLKAVHSFCNDKHIRHRSLRNFQRMTGEKENPHQLLWISQQITKDLSWLAKHFAARNRIYLFDAIAWAPSDADEVFYTDASATAFAVACAVHLASSFHPKPSCVAIFCNNNNTVEMPYNIILRQVVDILIHENIDLHVFHISGIHNTLTDTLSRGCFSFLSYFFPQIDVLPYAPPHTLLEALEYPTEDSLSFFAIYMCYHIKPTSVDSYLSRIQSQLEAYFPNIRQVHRSHLIAKTLQGCKHIHGCKVKCKRPLEPEDIVLLSRTYGDSHFHNDLLFLAQVTSGFSALNRLGELVWPDTKRLQSYHIVPMCHTVRWLNEAYSYFLPGHKGDRFFEGNHLVLQKVNSAIDSYNRFNFGLNRMALFPLKAGSCLAHFHQHFPADACRQSICAGIATALALTGVPNDHIQATGQWSSDAFEAYICKNPILLQALIWGRPVLQNVQVTS